MKHILVLLLCSWVTSVQIQAQTKPRTTRKAILISAANVVIPSAVGMVALNAGNRIGAPLTLYGVVLGASAGRIYVADYKGAAIGAGIRGATMVLFARALAESISDNREKSDRLSIVAGGIYLGELVWNVATMHKAVRRYNEARNLTFDVQPQIFRIDNKNTAGLMATLRF